MAEGQNNPTNKEWLRTMGDVQGKQDRATAAQNRAYGKSKKSGRSKTSPKKRITRKAKGRR